MSTLKTDTGGRDELRIHLDSPLRRPYGLVFKVQQFTFLKNMNTYWLNVPQEEATKAKELRCKWDADKRRWWKPSNVSIMKMPKHWLPEDLIGKNIYTRGKKGRKAALKATCVKVWDSELNIVYPSMKCAQDELSLTYKQISDLCALGTRYKKI